MQGGWIRISRWTVFCISHRGANTDGVNLVRRAETRLLLTGVEPGQDTLSGALQQRGVRVRPESSLSARWANSKGVSSTGGLSGNFDFGSRVCAKIKTGSKDWTLQCGAALQR